MSIDIALSLCENSGILIWSKPANFDYVDDVLPPTVNPEKFLTVLDHLVDRVDMFGMRFPRLNCKVLLQV